MSMTDDILYFCFLLMSYCGVPMHSFKELIRLDERNGMEYPYVLVPIQSTMQTPIIIHIHSIKSRSIAVV